MCGGWADEYLGRFDSNEGQFCDVVIGWCLKWLTVCDGCVGEHFGRFRGGEAQFEEAVIN